MKLTLGLLTIFFVYHKTIDSLNPWWRLLILPIIWLVLTYRKQIDAGIDQVIQYKKSLLIIKIVFFMLLAFRGGKSIYNTYRPLKAIEDIAVVHKQAVEILFQKKENPYKHILFEQVPIIIEKDGKKDTYSGFIYTPLGMIYYAPFILWLGKKGMYAGNLIGYWGLFILSLLILSKKSSFHTYLGGSLFLAVDYIFTKAFNRGTNDFLPALLMLLSIFYLSRNKNKLSGIFLGLSLGFKQYPGAIISFIFLHNKKIITLSVASIVFAICILPFAINDFTSLYRQIFEVFLLAPMGNTILKDLPSHLTWPIPLFAVLGMSYLSYKRRLANDWSSYLIPFLLFIIFTKSSFTTYFICIFPISIFFFLGIPERGNISDSEEKQLV
tara:strand:+ start:107710 stop:108855 length:1146 start_codon:yes stop_codon:yes gene_type:complete